MTQLQTVVLASGNKGKLKELQATLAPLGIALHAQNEFNVIAAEETGLSFVENAILKARAASAQSGLPAIGDDSGIEVDYLNGAPGIYSARYAADTGDESDAANNEKLLKVLADVPTAQRSARFQCVLVFMRHAEDPTPIICQGSWEGRILEAPRGVDGFGYDPLFLPDDSTLSAAELAKAEKNRISHRAKASALLLAALRGAVG